MKMLVNVTEENREMLKELKFKGQTIQESVNIALDMYRIMLDNQRERRARAARQQELAAQRHVDELFETMEFRSEVFKRAWVEAVFDKFEDYID